MRGGPTNRALTTRCVVAGLAALALALGGCGGDDTTAGGDDTAGTASTTTSEPKRSTTTVADVAPPKIPADTARDVDRVRAALKAAGYTVTDSRFPGKPLAQLEVGAMLVAFYAKAADATRSAAGLKKAFDNSPGRGLVRASGTRLYTVSAADKLSAAQRDRFMKIVSTSEGAL